MEREQRPLFVRDQLRKPERPGIQGQPRLSGELPPSPCKQLCNQDHRLTVQHFLDRREGMNLMLEMLEMLDEHR
jgi:hypothetical protein